MSKRKSNKKAKQMICDSYVNSDPRCDKAKFTYPLFKGDDSFGLIARFFSYERQEEYWDYVYYDEQALISLTANQLRGES